MSRAVAAYAAGKDQPHAKADKITIPAGFQVSGITVTASGVSQTEKDQNWVSVTCGSFQYVFHFVSIEHSLDMHLVFISLKLVPTFPEYTDTQSTH